MSWNLQCWMGTCVISHCFQPHSSEMLEPFIVDPRHLALESENMKEFLGESGSFACP